MKEYWGVIHRHQRGNHSRNCQKWDSNYLGFVCKYSWEPYGPTAYGLIVGRV